MEPLAARTILAIDVGHRELHAVEAVVERSRVTVVRVVHARVDDEAEGEMRGQQVRAALDAAGVTASTAVWTLPRERVVFKRIDLPGAEAHELPSMVRLAVQNETSMGADAALDFVQLAAGPQPAGGKALWAVAAPKDELDSLERLAEAAHIGVERVAPRTCGTAALVTSDACTVAFDLSSESAELVAVDRAGLRATRGTTLPSDTADAAVTEARRSWAALGLSQPDLAPVRALVLGRAAVSAALAAALETSIPVERLESHPDIDCGAHDLSGAWPLAGLLLEEARKSARIDLAHPRRAPDLAARKRLRVYAAVSVVLLAYCVGWLVGGKDRAAVESRRTDLASKADGARDEYYRYLRDELKAKHVDAWVAAQPRWMDAMLQLHGFAPDPAKVLLDGWNGQVEDVEVGVAKDGAFALPPGVRIAMDIETTDRATADALREALVTRREWSVKSTSSEGKVGRRLPVAAQLQLYSATGTPLDTPAGDAANGGTSP